MASIAQVARKAGVSATTASFVLNGRGKEMRISEAAAEKVMGAARELGYRSNYHARTLVRGRAMTLGLVNPYRPGDVFRLAVTTGMMQVARANDYEVLNIGGKSIAACMQRGVQYVQECRIDGMVVFQEAPVLLDDPQHCQVHESV